MAKTSIPGPPSDKGKFIKLRRAVRYYYRRLQRLRGNPATLAGGFAIGVFIGLTPTIPLHTVIILALTLVTRTSAVAGILSSWLVSNPITYLPIYYLSLVIGNAVTPYRIDWQTIKAIVTALHSSPSITHSLAILGNLGFEVIIVMVVGGCILALPFALVSYYLSLRFFVTIRRRRQQSHVLK